MLPASALPPITWSAVSSRSGARTTAPASSSVTSLIFRWPILGSIRRVHIRAFSAAVEGLFSIATTSLLYRSYK